jgi:hypothetical protein
MIRDKKPDILGCLNGSISLQWFALAAMLVDDDTVMISHSLCRIQGVGPVVIQRQEGPMSPSEIVRTQPAVGRPVTPLRPRQPAAPPPPVPAAEATGRSRRSGPAWTPVILAVTGLLALSVFGASYYVAEPAARVRDPLHVWLRPSGYVGQSAGVLALSIFFFLWLYPLRKKVRWLRWTGTMARWLDVHIAAALVLPVLAAVHASWRFDGLIGLGFWSMIVVCLSGIVGRYLYVHIPRSATGLELTAEEIAGERRRLMDDLARSTSVPAAQVEALLQSDPTPCHGLGVAQTMRQMLRDERVRWRAARALRRLCQRQQKAGRLDRRSLRRIVRLARREMALTQQARMLEATQRVFRLWHVAHRPFAITALVAVLVHVGVAVSMGMTWFW